MFIQTKNKSMKEKIIKYLKQIESEKNIKILLACETGSRAWGFPSPDSDYDVRVIYKHNVDWYLSINDKKDTYEQMLDNNEIDISGWDLKKSLSLLWKSNPPLLERIQSPIIYIADTSFLSGVNDLAKKTYSKISTMHHYLSLSKKMYSEIKDVESIKLKKLFYALRCATACKWIEEKEEMPPIVFQTMLENLEINTELKMRITELIDFKKTKNEGYFHHQEIAINSYIENCIMRAEKIADTLPASKGNIEELNSFFISNIK